MGGVKGTYKFIDAREGRHSGQQAVSSRVDHRHTPALQTPGASPKRLCRKGALPEASLVSLPQN